MKLVTYGSPNTLAPALGALVEGGIADLSAVGVTDQLIDVASGGEAALRKVAEAIRRAPVISAAVAPLLAPLPQPGKIIGVGLNYVEHVEESSRSLDTAKELPERPVLFGKPATAVIGPDGEIEHDGELTEQLDWEVELAVVIGKTARRVSEQQAMSHVFGYSITNDISARDQRRSGQWFFSKGLDTYAPLGPCVVTADEIPDPHILGLSLRVNGVTKQDSNTRYMLFRIPRLIADISSGMTLEPGDVIATGSPSGVGAGRTPPEFLKPGDAIEAEIEAIGVLRNRVVDASTKAAA